MGVVDESGAASPLAPTAPRPDRAELIRRGLLLEYVTVGWNIVEGLIAIVAGFVARSPALIGFGVDSFVETISGAVLVVRLRFEATGQRDDSAVDRLEEQAERVVGIAFLVLAAYVAFDAISALIRQEAPEGSPVGIGLTVVSIAVMLWLAGAKLATGKALGSRALIADSKQTRACWYLSVTALAGLAVNAGFGFWWADPVAALGIVFFLAREGLEAIRGEDDDD